METVTQQQQQRLPQAVVDELRREFNSLYKLWREDNPDDDIIDWLKDLPWSMHWSADYDTDSKAWRAWVDFCIWFTEQNRRLVATTPKLRRRHD